MTAFIGSSVTTINLWVVDDRLLVALIRTGEGIPPHVFIPLSLEEVTEQSNKTEGQEDTGDIFLYTVMLRDTIFSIITDKRIPLSLDPFGLDQACVSPEEAPPPVLELTITAKSYTDPADTEGFTLEFTTDRQPTPAAEGYGLKRHTMCKRCRHAPKHLRCSQCRVR